ncbi:McbB family protein [Pseudovibrio denitrificans]|uniref:McbB family protein n=1 Tax=Pseudovibrio denitrificans TaxID=258256 RepID=A0A1I7DZJ3_9HYPH|nr:hypothetical protein [Pseudovibrio denitrificans]SFU17078.1 McbB family protein [Pseudovibrio denitrificans]
MYCIQNFGHSDLTQGIMVQSSLGFFEITDPAISNIVLSLPKGKTLTLTGLYSLIKKHSRSPIDEVVEYFEVDLGIIVRTSVPRLQLELATTSDQIANIANKLGYPSQDDQHEQKKSKLVIVAFEGYPDTAFIKQHMDSLDARDRLLVGFQARDCYIISSVWYPDSLTPCPLCNIDFALDRIFFDPKDAMMGLSDVYDLTKTLGGEIPAIPLDSTDIAFIIRYLKQYTDALVGGGFAAFSPFDPLMTSVIDVPSLKRQTVKVPFSPLCDCIRTKTNVGDVMEQENA